MAENKHITFGQFEDFVERADERLDDIESQMTQENQFTLSVSGWSNDSGKANFPYQYKLAVTGVTIASRVECNLDDDNAERAGLCGMSSAVSVEDGYIIFRSRKIPNADITGMLEVEQPGA